MRIFYREVGFGSPVPSCVSCENEVQEYKIRERSCTCVGSASKKMNCVHSMTSSHIFQLHSKDLSCCRIYDNRDVYT